MLPRNLHITEVLWLSADFLFPPQTHCGKDLEVKDFDHTASGRIVSQNLDFFICYVCNLMLLNSSLLRMNAISISII